MLFKKKQTKLEEAPLNYWEEKSFMLVIPEKEDENIIRNSMDRLSSTEEIELIENNYNVEENTFYLKLKYLNEEYEVGFYYGRISVPEYYLNRNFLFTEEEKEKILKARNAITIFMEFKNNVKKSYHLQLKLAVALVPDLIGIMDESAEKMLPAKWVKMAAASKILPGSNNLFTVQAVASKDKKVWLHTHGLNRCGITELEILESDEKNYQNHYNLLNTYAMYLVDKKEVFNPRDNGAHIGYLIDNTPIVVTCISWTKGILEYQNLDLGNIRDRENGHNSQTSVVFLYRSEEDEKNHVLSKVSIYDNLWGENPIFFISDDETCRMKALAQERYDYIEKAFKDKENVNHILIKIGLPLKEEGEFEHIWFELLEIKNNRFKARLTQEPYDIENMHTNDEACFTKEDITDWTIYTKEYTISPENAYLLEK